MHARRGYERMRRARVKNMAGKNGTPAFWSWLYVLVFVRPMPKQPFSHKKMNNIQLTSALPTLALVVLCLCVPRFMVLLLLSIASAAASGLSLSGAFVAGGSWLGAAESQKQEDTTIASSAKSRKQKVTTDPVAKIITSRFSHPILIARLSTITE